MNAMHFHLMLNHIPILGAVFGLGLLLYGILRSSEELKRAALAVFIAVAIVGIPAYLTGEPSEDGVKGLAGVSGPIIEKHEQAAGVTFVLLLGLGLGALASLLWFRGRKVIPSWSHVSLLAVSIIVVGSGFWTAISAVKSGIRRSARAPSRHRSKPDTTGTEFRSASDLESSLERTPNSNLAAFLNSLTRVKAGLAVWA